MFVETTLELLQYVSITIPDAELDGSVFHGDQHGCQLYCWRCKSRFRDIVELDELLAKAPVDILTHFALWPEQCEKQNPQHVYPMLPPMFSSMKEYQKLCSLERRYRLSKRSKATTLGKANRCMFGHDNIVMAEKLGHLSPVDDNLRHLRSFQEAVNIDGNFAARKEAMENRQSQTKNLLNILFERMIHVIAY